MTEKVTHAVIMKELEYIKKAEDKIEGQLGLLNGTVRSNTITIACIKATAGTISAIVALVVTSVITWFSGRIK